MPWVIAVAAWVFAAVVVALLFFANKSNATTYPLGDIYEDGEGDYLRYERSSLSSPRIGDIQNQVHSPLRRLATRTRTHSGVR